MVSKQFRTSNSFLRNEFESSDMWGFPLIRKQELDLSNIDLIACSDTSSRDTENLHKGVHFFTDDYRFESLYMHPVLAPGENRQYGPGENRQFQPNENRQCIF